MVGIVDDLKQKGNEAFAKKEYKKAAKIYRDAIKLDPTNFILYSNRAMAFLKIEDFERALNDCDTGLNLSPDLKTKVKLMFRKAAALSSLNQLHESKRLLSECLELDPMNQAANKELDRIEEITSEQNLDDKVLTSAIPNASKRKREDSREIFSIVEIPIESVEELPSDFQPIQTQNIQEIQSQTQPKIMSLEEELSQIEGVIVPSVKKQPIQQQKPQQQPQQQPHRNDRQNSGSSFPQNPTLLYLSTLDKLRGTSRESHYVDVLNLQPNYLKNLFKSVGIDSAFLNYYMDAVICQLQGGFTLNSSSNVIESLEVFTKTSRFSLVLMFLPTDKLQTMKSLIHEKLGIELDANWS